MLKYTMNDSVYKSTFSKKGVIQRVHPCVVGSCKTKLTLYKYTTA